MNGWQKLCGAAIALLAVVSTGEVAEGTPPRIEIEYLTPLESQRDGRARVKVFFQAYQPGTVGRSPRDLYRADLGDAYNSILVNGAPCGFYLVDEPTRVSGGDTALVLLLAIDVSGSMGNSQYEWRMAQVRKAVQAFLSRHTGAPNVYVRLLPFGHDVPQRVSADGAWVDRYLSLSADASLLSQGIEEIDRFVLSSGRRVDTAFYGVLHEGVRELGELGVRGRDLERSKSALIVLTDGRNDLDRHPDSPFAHLDLDTVLAKIAAPTTPPVHVIGFGRRHDLERTDMRRLGAASKISVRFVAAGASAERILTSAYDEILEHEGRSWSLEVAVPEAMATDLYITTGETPRAEMLLLPSPLSTGDLSRRLSTFLLSALVLAVAGVVWSKFRPSGVFEPEGNDASQSGAVESSTNDIPPVSGTSVQQWLSRDRPSESGT